MFGKSMAPTKGSTSVCKSFDKLKNPNLLQTGGFINGQFTAGSAKEYFPVTNPANGEVLVQMPRMTAADVEQAAIAANNAFAEWKLTTAFERSALMLKFSELMQRDIDDLALILTLEAGKPLKEAKDEVQEAITYVDFYAEECKRINGEVLQNSRHHRREITLRQPIGPAALITPWNFPSAMITRKLSPAIAAGCTAVLKPPQETPLSALALCVLTQEAGFPAGVVNCLTVSREEIHSVGAALCHSPLIRKISFTGSTPVGKWLLRESADMVKKVSLELGGNAPFIVFEDADLDAAVAFLMTSKFNNSGQCCVSANRVLVQASIYDRFAQMVAEAVQKLRIGDGLQPETTVGPLINAKGLNKVKTQVEDCIAKGAHVLVGGQEVADLNAAGGTFFQPTVLKDLSPAMLPFSQETFGPIVSLMRFTTEEEAISLANDTEFGLASYFCTRDLTRAWKVAESLEAGIIGVNVGTVNQVHAPFGGWKESGLGREGGYWGMDEYLEDKHVSFGLPRP